MKCNSCKHKQEDKVVFCENCGNNFQIESLLGKFPELNMEGEIKTKDEFYRIEKTIEDFKDTETIFYQQKDMVRSLMDSKQSYKSMQSRLKMMVKKSKQDLDRATKFGISSIKLAATGRKDEVIEIRNKNYLDALAEMYEFENLENNITDELKLAKKQFDQIKRIYVQRNYFINNVERMLIEFNTDKSSPELDSLKNEIKTLEAEIEPRNKIRTKLTWARTHLINAKRAYNRSHQSLINAKDTSSIFFNTKLNITRDLVINSNQSKSRKQVLNGNRSLNEARKLLKNIQSINLPNANVDISSRSLFNAALQDIDLKGDYLLSNLLQKHNHNKKIQNAKNGVNSGINQIGEQLQMLNKYLFHLNREIEPLQRNLKDKKRELIIKSLSSLV